MSCACDETKSEKLRNKSDNNFFIVDIELSVVGYHFFLSNA